MPLFEYICHDCGQEFEEMAPSSDDSKVRCPACQSANIQRQMSAVRCQSGSPGGQPGTGCAPAGGFS